MKARLVASLLSVLILLSLTGCTKTDTINVRAKEWGYFYFPNTDWGMTEDELFVTLKKEKSDFVFVKLGDRESDMVRYIAESEVFGDKVETHFSFMTTLVSDVYYLASVEWVYKSDFTEEKGKEIMEKLDTLFEKQGIATTDEWKVSRSELSEDPLSKYQKESIAHMADLPQEIQDTYNKSMRGLHKSGKYNFVPVDDVDKYDFIKAGNRNLSGVSVRFDKENNSGIVTMSSFPVVEAVEYIKYAELQ